jgi:hypothetical protein
MNRYQGKKGSESELLLRPSKIFSLHPPCNFPANAQIWRVVAGAWASLPLT